MPKIILFNKFIETEQLRALVLMKSHETVETALLPHEHEILDEEILKLALRKSKNGNFLFGYFKDSLEFGFPLNIFKTDFFDYEWIDLEKFYENPIEYIQKGWWNEMDKEDFLIFLKSKNEILEYFDLIKSS